jgi:hypothetical protein
MFIEPKHPPSFRSLDHKIPLIPKVKPINIKPYESSFMHKKKIDKLVKKMLQNENIKHNYNPFVSLILLVKNKDNNLKLCVDYKQLNILIDDLMDESHGSQLIFKMDLRLGHHQVKIYDEDIEKITFKTHNGHCKFKV